MADYLYIREYASLSQQPNAGSPQPIPLEDGERTDQKITISSTATSSAALQPSTAFVLLESDAEQASFVIGNSAAVTGIIGFSGDGTCVDGQFLVTIGTATAGTILPGDTLAGTLASKFPANTTILAYGTGGATGTGGTGTYATSAACTATEASSTAVTTESNGITLTAVAGYILSGLSIAGTALDSKQTVTGQVFGTTATTVPGGTGVYTFSGAQIAYTASAAYTVGNVATVSSWLLPENTPRLFGVTPGSKFVVSVIANT